MPKKYLTITKEINCGKETCGNCSEMDNEFYYCILFDKDILHLGKKAFRCDECLDAEIPSDGCRKSCATYRDAADKTICKRCRKMYNDYYNRIK